MPCPVFPCRLSKDSRLNLVKVANEEKERSKVHARKVRKDAMDTLKKCKKHVSEDEIFRVEKEVERLVHVEVEGLEKIFEAKKSEILEG